MDFLLYLRDRHRDVGGPVTSGALFQLDGGVERYWDHRLDQFTSITRAAPVTVLLHGFNVTCSRGREALAAYTAVLRRRSVSGIVLCVLWPGDGWAKALSYPAEAKDADDAAAALARWLLRNAGRDARISFVAHSLGCRVAMTAAQCLLREGGRGAPTLERVCLMAPALDNDCLGLRGTACFQETTLELDRIAVLASEQDEVLRFAYPLGDLAQMVLGRGHWGQALGRTGPRERSPEIVAKIAPVPLSRPSAGIDHGDYLTVLPAPAEHTEAMTENFVAPFLAGSSCPPWPPQR